MLISVRSHLNRGHTEFSVQRYTYHNNTSEFALDYTLKTSRKRDSVV